MLYLLVLFFHLSFGLEKFSLNQLDYKKEIAYIQGYVLSLLGRSAKMDSLFKCRKVGEENR